MTVIKPLYGSDGVAITLTLTSLSAGNARESTAVDNSSDLYIDALVQVKTKTSTGTIGTDPWLYLYVLSSDDAGTTWPDPATGSDAAITAGNNVKARLLGAVSLAAASTAYKSTAFSVLQALGGIALPKKWSVVAVNATGVALTGTGGDHAVTFQGVQGQLV